MNVQNILERVISARERRLRSIQMKKHKTRLLKARERLKTRYAPEKNIFMRAAKTAKQILRKRLAGKRGAEYQYLAPSDKIAVDKIIDKKAKLIKKIALKLIPRIKRLEQQRLIAIHANNAAIAGKSLGNIPLTPVTEVKTAKTDLDHRRARLAQLSRRKRQDKIDAIEKPRTPQGLPSSKLPKQPTPASKKRTTLMIMGDDSNSPSLSESFNIEKPSGYGTFLTAKEMGIKLQGGFAYHPDVEQELEERKTKCLKKSNS